VDQEQTEKRRTEMNLIKMPWQSKMLWMNLIAIVAMYIQAHLGFVMSAQDQMVILGFVNIMLRFFTKKQIVWTNQNDD
jgi:uncharacterized membrane-anchored protein